MDHIEAKILRIIDEHADELQALAEDLFNHPEQGYYEYRTAQVVSDYLKKLGLETKEGLAITGLVLLIKRCKNLYWADAEEQLPKGTVGKTAYRNVGMILYMALCALSIILALI